MSQNIICYGTINSASITRSLIRSSSGIRLHSDELHGLWILSMPGIQTSLVQVDTEFYLNIYGPPESSKLVARGLGSSDYYLDHPYVVKEGVRYKKPHARNNKTDLHQYVKSGGVEILEWSASDIERMSEYNDSESGDNFWGKVESFASKR